MRTAPIPFAGGAYADETKPFSLQDTLNYRAQRTERTMTRSPDKLQTLPGLRPSVGVQLPAVYAPVRGTHNAEGKLLAVVGSTLYRISNGVAIPLGTVPGSGRVQMDHNQISLGNEVTITNGSAGYVWNSVTDIFGRITDAGYPGSAVARFVSGYMIGIEPQGRYAFSSLPAQATEFNTLDRFTSEVSPDRLVGAAARGTELLLLSTTSGEFFQATANARQPFRTMRASFKRGAASPHGQVEADGTIYWLGADGVWYMLNGYGPQRISTRPMEREIEGLDWSRAFAFLWDTVVYWTFPDGKTWGYDFAEREWHRRASYGIDRWRVNSMTRWNDQWIAGDYQRGQLWSCNLGDRYFLEGDQEYVCRRTMGVLHDHQNLVRIPRIELVMDTGQPETIAVAFAAQPIPPTITGDAPNGTVELAYSYAYTLASGTPPYVVTLRSGTLPAGLTLSMAGVLSGTPTTEAAYTWTVRVTDATGLYDDLDDSATMDITWWLAAPVNQNGALGGSTDYYIRAPTVAGMFTATPTANPAAGSGAVQRLSVANGKVFMHRATLACMSSNFGVTWTACDNSLYGSSWGRDVFWNGTAYYYGGVTSVAGLVWAAIPNLPAGARVQSARASDGRIVVQAADGVCSTSIDNGANWVTVSDLGISYTDPIAADATDYALSSSGPLQYYSTDNLATISVSTPQSSPTFGHFYANGAWFVLALQSGDGIASAVGVIRTTDVTVWPVNTVTANYSFIIDGVSLEPTFMALNGAGEGIVRRTSGSDNNLYATADNGVTWALAGTLYGPPTSIVGMT